MRIWLVGFGTVGQWLVRALDAQAERLADRYGVGVAVVGLANARDGFVYDENGLDLASALALAGEGRSIAEQSPPEAEIGGARTRCVRCLGTGRT